MHSWTIRARVVSWSCQSLAMVVAITSMIRYLRWVHLSAHQERSTCWSAQAHLQRDSGRSKYLQKNASWLEMNNKGVASDQIQFTATRSTTYLFIHALQKVQCLTPHLSYDAHGNTMEHRSSHAWMAMRKGRLHNVNMRGRSQTPRMIATKDLTIRSCRTAPSCIERISTRIFRHFPRCRRQGELQARLVLA